MDKGSGSGIFPEPDPGDPKRPDPNPGDPKRPDPDPQHWGRGPAVGGHVLIVVLDDSPKRFAQEFINCYI